jgi:modification methylase
LEAVELATSKIRSRARLPFGALVENGYLRPGDVLFFKGRREMAAMVLANGHIRLGEYEGSIHQLGRLITGAPCNGWEHWYFLDPATGILQPVDVLRKRLLAKMNEQVFKEAQEDSLLFGSDGGI